MSFKRTEILILLQIILITLTATIMAWAFIQTHINISGYYFFVLLVLEVTGLFLFINRQNRNLVRFLESLVHRDELSQLEEVGNRKEIHRLLNQIAESYSQVKIEKESEHQYLLNTVKHVNIGLLSFNPSGQIELFNKALEELLGIRAPVKLETLAVVSEDLPELLMNLKPGKPLLYKLALKGEILHLSLNASSFRIQEHIVKLVSIQDIASEIQQEEIVIWQKLIRVLTHEIMNSAGPITSLSSTLLHLLDELPDQGKSHQKIKTGLTAIEKRSKGLAKFVETYRSLTKVPEPVMAPFGVKVLIDECLALVSSEYGGESMEGRGERREERGERGEERFEVDVRPADLEIVADEKLISQVIINILKNAFEAQLNSQLTTQHSKLSIVARRTSLGHVSISVNNPGPAIPSEILEKVFVPFFTTKESGSGIGLSLSRQIMNKHGGSIKIVSNEEFGTTVFLEFV